MIDHPDRRSPDADQGTPAGTATPAPQPAADERLAEMDAMDDSWHKWLADFIDQSGGCHWHQDDCEDAYKAGWDAGRAYGTG